MTAPAQADMATVARRFHALSDPTRLRILDLLAQGQHCVCELTGALGAAQSRLSFHLKVLREAGLLQAHRSGRWMYYAIDLEVVAQAGSYLEELQESTALSGPAGHICRQDGGCCG